MKFVYILICNDDNFFAEQTLVSMFSLRYYNPKANIVLIVDQDTSLYLNKSNNKIFDYIDDIIIATVPNELSPKKKSRFLKTSLRLLIDGDYIYLDCDTIICGSLHEMLSMNCQMGAVIDNHGLLDNFQFYDYMNKTHNRYIKFCNYFNTGILFVKDTPLTREFYKDWHNHFLKDMQRFDYDFDQPSCNIINHKYEIIQKLDDKFNFQLITPSIGEHRVEKALIIHYFTSIECLNMFFPFREFYFIKKIRNKGINEEMKAIILNSKDFIYSMSCYLDEREKQIYISPVVVLARKISRDYPWTNKLVQRLYRLFGFKI